MLTRLTTLTSFALIQILFLVPLIKILSSLFTRMAETISPVEGQDGMMLEFDLENDGLGRRSSLLHCITDFYLDTAMAVTCWFLRISKLEVYKNYEKVQTGITDFLYKFNHGYNSYSLGQKERIDTSRLTGITLWGNYWADHYNINLYEGE